MCPVGTNITLSPFAKNYQNITSNCVRQPFKLRIKAGVNSSIQIALLYINCLLASLIFGCLDGLYIYGSNMTFSKSDNSQTLSSVSAGVRLQGNWGKIVAFEGSKSPWEALRVTKTSPSFFEAFKKANTCAKRTFLLGEIQ